MAKSKKPSAKKPAAKKAVIVPIERIAASIYVVRGQKVMLDSDLAVLYGVETKVLNQAVRRNLERFPADFMFQLSPEELEQWRSQIVTSKPESKMGLRYSPHAFTEHGVAMLSSVLKSKRAVEINIAIVRTFIRIRHILASHEELARKVAQHDRDIAVLVKHVRGLLEPPEPKKKKPIGFAPPRD